jgi:hypothetical protein
MRRPSFSFIDRRLPRARIVLGAEAALVDVEVVLRPFLGVMLSFVRIGIDRVRGDVLLVLLEERAERAFGEEVDGEAIHERVTRVAPAERRGRARDGEREGDGAGDDAARAHGPPPGSWCPDGGRV